MTTETVEENRIANTDTTFYAAVVRRALRASTMPAPTTTLVTVSASVLRGWCVRTSGQEG